MKQLFIVLGLFFCLGANAQKKADLATKSKFDPFAISTNKDYGYKFDAHKEQNLVATLSVGSDTLVILDSCHFIKVGENVFKPSQLKAKGVYLPIATLQKIIDGLQELPAKTANPVTQFILETLKKDQVLP